MTPTKIVPRRLTPPPAAVKRLAEADIRCFPKVTVEYQRAAGKYCLRGRESGGAIGGIRPRGPRTSNTKMVS
jgi:hypothetical protein